MAYRFEGLEIWKVAIAYAKRIYKITENFPRQETYGLTNQLRRAVVSVSSNIAEGSASDSSKDFKNFLNYSIRSLAEVTSELSIAKALGYLEGTDYQSLYNESEVLVKRIVVFKRALS